jgi:hypothetical protein
MATVKMDAAGSAIARLSAEILRLIFESVSVTTRKIPNRDLTSAQLDWDSPSTLKPLSASCSRFYEMALPFLWDDVHIRFSANSDEEREFLLFLVAGTTNPRILQSIRRLIISGYSPSCSTGEVSLLHDFLQKCERLGAVRYVLRSYLVRHI